MRAVSRSSSMGRQWLDDERRRFAGRGEVGATVLRRAQARRYTAHPPTDDVDRLGWVRHTSWSALFRAVKAPPGPSFRVSALSRSC